VIEDRKSGIITIIVSDRKTATWRTTWRRHMFEELNNLVSQVQHFICTAGNVCLSSSGLSAVQDLI